MTLSVHPISPHDFKKVQQFCALQFGTNSYQACAEYSSWLYQENPLGINQGLQILKNSTLTTVAHEMMVWSNDFTSCVVPHNLFSYPETSTGLGGTVIMRYSKIPMIVPGATLPLTTVYEAAKFIEIPLRSYMSYFTTPAVAISAIKHRLFKTKDIVLSQKKVIELADYYKVKVDFRLNEDRSYLDQLVGHQHLSSDFLEWRYFSPNGPVTFVLSNTDGDFCFINIGLRKGLPLARLGDNLMSIEFAKTKVFPILKSLGVVVVMANSKRPTEWELFKQLNMRQINKNLKAFVTKHVDPATVTSPCFSDLGLEAIKTNLI